jgi:hypothetical protein
MYDFLIDIIPREDVRVPEYQQHPHPASATGTTSDLSILISICLSFSVSLSVSLSLFLVASHYRPLTISPHAFPPGPPPIAPTPTYVPYSFGTQSTDGRSSPLTHAHGAYPSTSSSAGPTAVPAEMYQTHPYPQHQHQQPDPRR